MAGLLLDGVPNSNSDQKTKPNKPLFSQLGPV